MKHILLALCFVLSITEAESQITITQGDFPGADDTAMISISDDVSIDVSGTGANYTWDYSDLHVTTQRIDTFFNVADASLTYQYQFNNVFTQPDYASDYFANLAGFDLGGISGMGITLEKPVSFVKISNSAVENVGIGVVLNGYEVPMAADTIDVEYELPMTFNDSWNSNSYIYVDLNPVFAGIFVRHQYRNSEVDGWGTITTGLGTFDVVRVRSEIAYDDSAYVDLGFGGTWLELPTPDEVHYTWWSEDNKVPVLKVVAQVVGGNETVTRVEFKDHERNLVSVNEYAEYTGEIYPNPASNMVNFTLDKTIKQVFIYTVTGELIYQNAPTNAVLNIDVQNWSRGMYLVKLIGDENVSSAKLIVE